MKSTTLKVVGVLMTLACGGLASAENTGTEADQWYRQGLRAMEEGRVQTARECFHATLRLRPNDMNARYQLKQLNLRKGSLLARKRELQLKAVTVPAVDFDQVNLAEALDALNAVVEKASKGKFVPNFIVQDPNGVLEERRFSLKLGQVPATVVLEYALENTGATARFDEHAIVVKPRRGTGS